MVNINRICVFKGCKTWSSFNFEGKSVGLYCTTHKKGGMVYVKKKLVPTKIAKNNLFIILRENPKDYIAIIIKKIIW